MKLKKWNNGNSLTFGILKAQALKYQHLLYVFDLSNQFPIGIWADDGVATIWGRGKFRMISLCNKILSLYFQTCLLQSLHAFVTKILTQQQNLFLLGFGNLSVQCQQFASVFYLW